MPKKKLSVVELLKSGNFTLAYHDNGYCSLYEGRLAYDKLPEESLEEFDRQSDGYIPDEVAVLVKALGGKVESV